MVFLVRPAIERAVYQLYSVPLGGGAVNRLNGSLGSGEAVATGFDISPDGNWVVYRSTEGTDNIYDLYSGAPITGGTANTAQRGAGGPRRRAQPPLPRLPDQP